MSDVSAVTHLLPKANEGFITTLGSTITAGATSVPLTSVTGLTNGTTFVGIIEPGGTKEQVFTGLVDTGGAQLTSVKWTKGSSVGHSGGVTIVDYVTGTAINMLSKWAAVEHNDDGTHNAITANSISTTSLTIAGRDASTLAPTGMMAPFAGTAAPTGWLLCDGSSVLRTTYSSLFSTIGTTYGSVDGTHFTLPDSRGRTLVGKGAAGTFATLGSTGGEETHILSTTEMPVHAHGVSDPGHHHGVGAGAQATLGGGGNVVLDNNDVKITGTSTTGVTIQNAGSGGAHNNLQPYLTVNHIIKT